MPNGCCLYFCQVNGEIEAVHDALLHITMRLKHHFFRDIYPSVNFPPNSAFLDQHSPFPPYLGRRGLSPPRMYSDLGPPHAGFPFDDVPPFMNNIHRPGIPPHISERKPWGPQVLDYYCYFLLCLGLFWLTHTTFAAYSHVIYHIGLGYL